jgi:hypothetical protein
MDLPSIRDLAVVVLAAVAVSATLVMAITGLLVWRLLAVIRTELLPIAGSLRETIDTVRDTVDTVGNVVTESSGPSSRAIRMFRALRKVSRARSRNDS